MTDATVNRAPHAAGPAQDDARPLVHIENACKYYKIDAKKTLKAVDGVTLDIMPGEAVGLVGESGCGKSTLGKIVSRIEPVTAGTVSFDGKTVNADAAGKRRDVLSQEERKQFCKAVQVVFQDPYSSLNPRQQIGKALERALAAQNLYPKSRDKRVDELLEMVDLPLDSKGRYPHEFSGGQRQRVCIARALAVEPRFLICDEPISALDVSIQAQIVNLLVDMKQRFGLTMLFISHDLSVVKYICDRVVVMYLGRIVETAPSEELYGNPFHYYTRALLSAILEADPDAQAQSNRIILEGDIPTPVNPAPGCALAGRCPFADDMCTRIRPELTDIGNGHSVACHHIDKVASAFRKTKGVRKSQDESSALAISEGGAASDARKEEPSC